MTVVKEDILGQKVNDGDFVIGIYATGGYCIGMWENGSIRCENGVTKRPYHVARIEPTSNQIIQERYAKVVQGIGESLQAREDCAYEKKKQTYHIKISDLKVGMTYQLLSGNHVYLGLDINKKPVWIEWHLWELKEKTFVNNTRSEEDSWTGMTWQRHPYYAEPTVRPNRTRNWKKPSVVKELFYVDSMMVAKIKKLLVERKTVGGWD